VRLQVGDDVAKSRPLRLVEAHLDAAAPFQHRRHVSAPLA